MSRPEIVPFSAEHLAGAAHLLADRHAWHRRAEPLLPARFEDPAETRAEIESLWRRQGAAGAAALHAGRLVGYLVGAPGSDAVWGANEWIEVAGQAVIEAEVVRDLYAPLAERWLDEGRNRHYAVVPASDPDLIDAWFRLSFGAQQAFGISEIPGDAWPDGVRRAEPRDVETLLELAPHLGRHHVLSPVFSGIPPDFDVDELRAEIESDLSSATIGNLVAERDGRIVGNFEIAPVELSSMHVGLARPEGACTLGVAVTLPEIRGTGVGLALTKASFAWAREAGYRTMVTDWRATNLLSSRFWPKRGFRETFLRLYRSIP